MSLGVGRVQGTAMRRKHRRIVATIFHTPVRGNLNWIEVESTLRALGANIEERRGSAIFIELNGEADSIHRPHPRRECGKGLVLHIRRFLERAGVAP